MFKESTYLTELSLTLEAGNYLIASYHEWFMSKMGRYFAFLSSQSHILLKKGVSFVDKDFLPRLILAYDAKQPEGNEKTNKIYRMGMVL